VLLQTFDFFCVFDAKTIKNEVIDYIQLHKERLDENGQRLVLRIWPTAGAGGDQEPGSDSSSSSGDRAQPLQRFLHGLELHSRHYFCESVNGFFGVKAKH
jgi:hypothetical protein